MHKQIAFILVIMTTFASVALSQHRGDNLAFQGFPMQPETGVKALAMGNAYTAMAGDLNSMFFNPAGLAEIKDFQISVSANRYAQLWRENQVYRPNRMFWTMAFYLEGLYTPLPENNGVWDYELAKDSAYVVNTPELGLEPFSEEAADWQKEHKKLAFNHLALALPFKVMGNDLVVSAAWSQTPILDFDRNDTWLDPHIGYDAYGVMERVVTDTLQFSWSRFQRERTGDVNNITLGLGYQFRHRLNLGLAVNLLDSETSDSQSLNRVGYFDIANNNRFRFAYDTLDVAITGESTFRAWHLNLGAQLNLSRLRVGFSIKTPYTLTRKWDYQSQTTDNLNTVSTPHQGEDQLKVPATYAFGLNLNPVDQFTIAFDYRFAPYQNSQFELSQPDSSLRDWVNQDIWSAGIEYKPLPSLSLLAGYRYLSEVFVPDGAAIKDKGPAATIYTLGAGIRLGQFGWLHLAYEMRRLKYYDSYFSNTNYVFEKYDNWVFGYTFVF